MGKIIKGKKKGLKREKECVCYLLSFRLSPPDTQHNLEPQLRTELADVPATIETGAIVTVSSRFCPWQMIWRLRKIPQRAHQGFLKALCKDKNKDKHGRDGCWCDKEVNEEPDPGTRAALLTTERRHMTCEDASVAMLVVAGYWSPFK